MERIETETVVAVIEKRLQRMILSGELRPEDALPPVTVLARECGCSAKTAATAAGRLEAKGLVRRERGNGYYVVDLIRSADLEIFVDLVRFAREPSRRFELIAQLLGFLKPIFRDMVERAAVHRTEEHLKWLQMSVSTLEGQCLDTVVASAVGEAEQNVLRILAGAAGNALYTVLLNSLWSLFVPRQVIPGAATLLPIECYSRLFHLLERKDVAGAGAQLEAAVLSREEECVAELRSLGWFEEPQGMWIPAPVRPSPEAVEEPSGPGNSVTG